MKTFIGIVRDHSASMRGLTRKAMEDYNTIIGEIQDGSKKQKQDTKLSVVSCGVEGHPQRCRVDFVNADIGVPLMVDYDANGGCTPLYDAVGILINEFKKIKGKASFLVMVITDGQENASRSWSGHSLGNEIKALQATDLWSFTFRVPQGGKQLIARNLGVHEGNILEWEQTEYGLQVATQHTKTAIASYYSARASGETATRSFFSPDLSDVSSRKVRAKLENISAEVQAWPIKNEARIREFVEKKLGRTMLKGAAFYQLVKPEKAVQDYKKIVVRNKLSQEVYGGDNARELLGFPDTGSVKVVPGDHGNYDIFVQSTSVNRKLVPGTDLIYWEKAGGV